MRVGPAAWIRALGATSLPGVYDPTVPMPPHMPAPMRARRRPGRPLAIVLGVAVAACCAAGTASAVVRNALRQSAASGTTDTTGTTDANGAGSAGQGAPAGPGAPPAQPGLNTAVRDGRFEFVVTSITCGHGEIVNGWLRAQPQGQFCVAEMTVANIGPDARHFADGSQKAFGPQGHTYAADTGAGVVANGNGNAVWNVVNPGNSIAAKVVFDLPPGGTIVRLELHDSPLSGGVTITLPTP